MRIKIVKLNALHPHEHHDLYKMRSILKNIRQTGKLRRPLLVDAKNLIVLDGHHRLAALRALGCTKVPALLVNYMSQAIILRSRRRNVSFSKQLVVKTGLSRRLLPKKTTRHLVLGGRKQALTNLSKLN